MKLDRKHCYTRTSLEQDKDDAQLRALIPAVFNTEPGPTALSTYKHISTFDAVAALRGLNYEVASAAQEHTERPWAAPFAKHVVRMRPVANFAPPPRDERTFDQTVPEVIITNAHNTSSSLHLMAGLWRFVCLNGLMSGTTLATYSLRHTTVGIAEQVAKIIDELTGKTLVRMSEQVDAMQRTMLKRRQQEQFAAQAIALRWGPTTEAVDTDLVLHPRRDADKGDSVWQTFNRVQENVLQGGFTARNRNRSIQPLTSVGATVSVNRALWDAAVAMAA